MELTIFGGKGFVGGHFVKCYYDAAIGEIRSVNARDDYEVHSKDVLYFISTVHNYNIFDEPFLDIETNLKTLVKVLENWRRRPDSKEGIFNFISSWFVYGGDGNGAKETDPCDPKGFYSITKRCAEQLLISYCETYGLKYRILRLGNIVGPGDVKVSARKNALQYLIGRLAANKSVELYGDGTQMRDYIHVQDCVKAIDLVLVKGLVNSIYNIGNGQTWCLRAIIMHAAVKLNSTSTIKYIEPKPFHKVVQSVSFYMNTEKLKSLGYKPEYSGEKLYDSLCEL